MMDKNVKIIDLQSGWDSDGTGKIDKEEFRDAILALGLEAKPEELLDLFYEFDADRSGSLKSKELVTSLTKLQKDAREQAAREASASNTVEYAYAAAEKATKEALRMAALYAEP